MEFNVNNYYTLSYNSSGITNLFDTNFRNLAKTIYLQSKSHILSTILIKKIITHLSSLNHNLDIIHNPLDNLLLFGLIDNDLGIGIIIEDATTHPFSSTKYYNLNKVIGQYELQDSAVAAANKDIELHISIAIDYFSKAKAIHDEWEKLYIDFMDFDKANMIANETITTILNNKNLEKKAIIKERFFGAMSPEGATNYVQEIINQYDNRYFIKGRPGTGKSTLLKKLSYAAQDKGIDTIIYYCASDSDSLDMLVMPELNTVLFDSTAPHEFFPNKENDIVIDMYTELLPESFDDTNKSIIANIANRYSSCVNLGIAELKDAKNLTKQIENSYSAIINFDKLNDIYKELLKEL